MSPEAAAVTRFAVATVRWNGIDMTVAGTGYTGEDGVECAVPADAAPDLWRAILDAAVAPAGLGARDTLRLEAGLPLHGHELGPGITPPQAGLAWVVAWDKPTFRGRDALLAERERGISRRLRGLLTGGRRPPRADQAILIKGEQVGVGDERQLLSVLERGIALGFVPPSVQVGDGVEISMSAANASARKS